MLSGIIPYVQDERYAAGAGRAGAASLSSARRVDERHFAIEHKDAPRKAFQVYATYLSSHCHHGPGHPIDQLQSLPESGQLTSAGQRQMDLRLARADTILNPPVALLVSLMPPHSAVLSVGICALV
jgi:hypothetical protein